MPVFDFAGPDGQTHSIEGPEGSTPEQAFAALQQHLATPQKGMAQDFVQSMPRGAAERLIGEGSLGANIGNAESSLEATIGDPSGKMGYQVPPLPSSADLMKMVESKTGPLAQPQGMAGKIGAGVAGNLADPLSYMGPGGLGLKALGAGLSGVGAEVGENVGGTPGRILGSLGGGAAAAKTLGPRAAEAAIPTAQELKGAAESGYDTARNSGVEAAPSALAQWAAKQQQELTNGPKYAFTGGAEGTAPKTMAFLDKLQQPPDGATVTAGNLDTIRRYLGTLASDTKEFKPTPDAKAAMVLKRAYDEFLQNPPQGAFVAGNPKTYANAVGEANANYSAASRVGNVQQRLDNAQTNYEGSIAARLDNQTKAQLRPILKNPKAQRGFTDDEISAISGVNKGTLASRTMSELGRGGAGVIPMIAHLGIGIPAAMATGGASLVPQAALMAGLYGARKAGERMTASQAKALVEMLAKRSPLYQQRAAGLPMVSNAPNHAQLLRSAVLGLQ